MGVVIKDFDKPASCLSCPFNRDDCWCSITHGGIDRDYYDCDIPCPIKPLDTVLDEIQAEIKQTVNEEQEHDKKWATGLRYALKIIDKYKEGIKNGQNNL